MYISAQQFVHDVPEILQPYPKMAEKHFLLDVDGVCLDWEHHFMNWATQVKGMKINILESDYGLDKRLGITREEADKLVLEFNNSSWISFLPPLRDAKKWIPKIHEDFGFKFTFITSMSLNTEPLMWRVENLIENFGKGLMQDVISLDTGAPKDEVLSLYKDTDCYWVEDKPSNWELGNELGLHSLLMAHDYNKSHHLAAAEQDALVVNWAQIYDIVKEIHDSSLIHILLDEDNDHEVASYMHNLGRMP